MDFDKITPIFCYWIRAKLLGGLIDGACTFFLEIGGPLEPGCHHPWLCEAIELAF
ncbi:hypothetical protein SAMN04488513_103219 [Pseudozobellia thermophila]|uniref:Uncharacterized protein n=1 Tax=Pseudozobellia thermophila TaxID=192903 RepID=A0A1M6HWS6_9FLAO|nr:hypothetical protein SAMN04488513_103219 [Pseudozobellia thermophila]